MRYALHVGLTKAGSTTIQSFLALNAQVMAERGIVYPMAEGYPTPPQHSWLSQALQDSSDPRLPDLIRRCQGHELAILSGETLINLKAKRAAQLRDLLANAGGSDFKVILYVRNLADRTLSRCAQRARVAGIPYETTVAEDPQPIGRQVAVFERVFGEDVVDIRLLDDIADLPQDFCAAAGLPWQADYVMPAKANASQDPLASTLLLMLRREFGVEVNVGNILEGMHAPRLENRYLKMIEPTLGRYDLSHPKLAPIADRLTSIRWRDESQPSDMQAYVSALIGGLSGWQQRLS